MKQLTLMIVFVLLIISGCEIHPGQRLDPTATTHEKVSTKSSPLNLPATPPDDQSPGVPQDQNEPGVPEVIPEGAVMVYSRSGGFAGVMETWTIFENGRVISNEGTGGQVDPAQIQELLTGVEALGFFSLQPNYIPQNPCCDLFNYELAIADNGRVHKVEFTDSSAGVPEELEQIHALISSLIEETALK